MTIRTSGKTVTFRRPFVLGGLDEVLPAGAYSVETDEELLEGISFPAYRQVLTLIRLHAKSGHPGRTRALTIDPNELDAALKRDQAPAERPADTDTGQRTLKGTTESRRQKSDRQAIERGEDEGVIVHQREQPSLRNPRIRIFPSPRLKPLPPIQAELQSRALVNSVGSELGAALGAYKKE